MSRLDDRARAAEAPRQYTISQLAEELDVTPRAIRFYESSELIAPRRVGTMRVYDHRDRARLLLILRGKRLGFSLAEIREWLSLYDLGDGQRRQLTALLQGSRRRIAELERQRRDLATTLDELREIERTVVTQLAEKGAAVPAASEGGAGRSGDGPS